MSNITVIITTIFKPSPQILEIIKRGYHVIIVADKKTPEKEYFGLNCTYLSPEKQDELFPELSLICPWNHYARKNIGYLYAIVNGYEQIIDTDDDNLFEYPAFPDLLEEVGSEEGWVNIFRQYTNENIWPRGLPFDKKLVKPIKTGFNIKSSDIAVWQGVVDGEPDVDAVYRLARPSFTPFIFEKGDPVAIKKNVICPFNSQNTRWTSCFEYMYIPSTVSFRYSDILRGYITNYGFWANGKQLAYTSATAIQQRNEHNIVDDLVSEISMYQTCYKVKDILDTIPSMSLEVAYQALYKQGIVSELELKIVQAWCCIIKDKRSISAGLPNLIG